MKRCPAFTAVAAFTAFGMFTAAQEKPAHSAKPEVPPHLARIKESLKFTPEQEAKIKEFNKIRQTELKAFADQVRKLLNEMQAIRRESEADLAKMNPLIDQIFKLRADQAKAALKWSRDWQNIFTPEQLEKIKDGLWEFGKIPALHGRAAIDSGIMMKGGLGTNPDMMRRGRDMHPGMWPGRDPGMGPDLEPDVAPWMGFDMDPVMMMLMMLGRETDVFLPDGPFPPPFLGLDFPPPPRRHPIIR